MKPSLRFSIWRRDGFRCTYCGISAFDKGVTLEVDHVIPVSRGGTDDPENLTTACRPCNWAKGPHRPRIASDGKKVVFQYPAWMRNALNQHAAPLGISRSQVIRRLLAKALEDEAAESVEAAS